MSCGCTATRYLEMPCRHGWRPSISRAMEVPMSTVRSLIAPLILLIVWSTAAVAGQQHLVSPSQLAATIDERIAAEAADRTAVREALARPQVRETAAKLGVDLAGATAAVDTLE